MGNERVKLNVSVPAELRKAAKVRAAANGETLESLVERGLRLTLTLDAELHARVVAAKGETSWQELVATWAKGWLASLPATEAPLGGDK